MTATWQNCRRRQLRGSSSDDNQSQVCYHFDCRQYFRLVLQETHQEMR